MREDENDGGVRVGDAARRVSEGIGDLGRAINDRQQDLTAAARDFMRERPIAALGIAFGVGYVLGGGLFSRTTSRVLGMGIKLGGMAFARNFLGGMTPHGQE
jgi:hypothetical protein